MADNDSEDSGGGRVFPFPGGGDPSYVPPPIPSVAETLPPVEEDTAEFTGETFPVMPSVPYPLSPQEALHATEGIPEEEADEFADPAEEYGPQPGVMERIADWIDQRVRMMQARHEAEAPLREAQIADQVARLRAGTDQQTALIEQQGNLRKAQLQAQAARHTARGKADADRIGAQGRVNSPRPAGGRGPAGAQMGADKGHHTPRGGPHRDAARHNEHHRPGRHTKDGKDTGGGRTARDDRREHRAQDRAARRAAKDAEKTAGRKSDDRAVDHRRKQEAKEADHLRREAERGAEHRRKQEAADADLKRERKRLKLGKDDESGEDEKKDDKEGEEEKGGAEAPPEKEPQEGTDGPSGGTDGASPGEGPAAPPEAPETPSEAESAEPPGTSEGPAPGPGESPDAGQHAEDQDPTWRERWARFRKEDTAAGARDDPPGPQGPVPAEDVGITVERADRRKDAPAIAQGPLGLPRAAESHSARPGTSRPAQSRQHKEQEDKVSTPAPVAGQSGLAAQHRTDITLDDYLMEIAFIAQIASLGREQASDLAVVLLRITRALRETAEVLASDHNLDRQFVDEVETLADQADDMRAEAVRYAERCANAAEAALLAARDVARVYNPDLEAMDDAGLRHASAAAHHQ